MAVVAAGLPAENAHCCVQFRLADPFLAAATLWAAMHGLVTLRASRPAFLWPPLADMIAAIARQTLHTSATPPGAPRHGVIGWATVSSS